VYCTAATGCQQNYSLKNISVTLGTNVSVLALHFVGIIVEMLILSELRKTSTEHRAFYDNSNSNTNITKDVNNETLTLNPEPREEF
jgi:high-affinity nickel permease